MRLHTKIVGEGEPIVFLHTGLQTGETDFEYQRNHFQKDFTIILPDLRGHGKSRSEDLTNYFEDGADDLYETLTHYGFDQVHIVGCSLGALVAIFFAIKYPSAITSLTISGVLPAKPENWLATHKEEVKNQTLFLDNKEATAYFDEIHSSDWRQFVYMARNEDWYPFEETATIDLFDFPVLFLIGEGNPYETVGAIRYAQQNKNIHLSIIPFAAHLVHAEQPEIYTNILEKFLNDVCKNA